jgi:cyclic pyranopterin phosphate synthase
LTKIEVKIEILDEKNLQINSTVKTIGQTGVEMEALVATTTSLLTIWDMVKQYEKDLKGQYPSTSIKNIHIVEKIKR